MSDSSLDDLWKHLDVDSENITSAPEAVKVAIKDLLKNKSTGQFDEKRRHQRHEVSISSTMIPVSSSFRPIGDPFEAIVRNLSVSGLGILHTRSIAEKSTLAMRLLMANDKELRMIGTVKRCRPTGRFYDIGIQFSAKFND